MILPLGFCNKYICADKRFLNCFCSKTVVLLIFSYQGSGVSDPAVFHYCHHFLGLLWRFFPYGAQAHDAFEIMLSPVLQRFCLHLCLLSSIFSCILKTPLYFPFTTFYMYSIHLSRLNMAFIFSCHYSHFVSIKEYWYCH